MVDEIDTIQCTSGLYVQQSPLGKSHGLSEGYLLFYYVRLSDKNEMLAHHIPAILVLWRMFFADAVFDIGGIYGLYSFHICM